MRTRKAASASCHQMSTGINSGADSNDPSCQTLQDTLGKALALTDPSALKAKDVRLPTADELARRISLAYNKASYKTLQMDDHGGVLAIQWLPIDVRHTPKGKGQKAGGEK